MATVMKRARSAALLLLASTAFAGAPATLSDAARAYKAYDLAGSRRLYESILETLDSPKEDRIAACQALAGYDWKFDGDAAAAARHLDAALHLGGPAGAIYSQRCDLELASGSLRAALSDAQLALEHADGPREQVAAKLLYGKVILAAGRKKQGGIATPKHLRAASQGLDSVLEQQPGESEASETLLGIALLDDDGPTMLRAWMSYFFFADEVSVSATMSAPYASLNQIAGTWHGRPLAKEDRSRLALALARSRFYDLAVMVAPAAPGAELREDLAYERFLEAVGQVNRQFYPRVAKGLKDYAPAYDAAMIEAARPLLAAIGKPVPSTKDTDDFFDAFFKIIRERFGADGYVGDTVNYHGMLAGHVVLEETRQVTQYGKTARFQYVSLDRLFSRDFTSWYGTTNVGGWGTEATMYQVRAAYLTEPYRRLDWERDPAARAELQKRIAALDKEDLVRCAADRYAEPAALPLRIKLMGSDRIYAQLQTKGLKGSALALAFVAECMRLSVEATVFAHEGRHSLDQQYFKRDFDAMDDGERELRAKYSEVAFSSFPRLALTGSLIGGQLDESSGHGKANKRFRVLLVDWMAAHTAEIPGLDPKRPLIMQADLLTDDQLVGLVRGADPMAKPAP